MSLDTLITKFTNFDQGTHGIEIKFHTNSCTWTYEQKWSCLQPIGRISRHKWWHHIFMKEQYMESSFQFMCHAYNSRTRSKDVQGDHMATRLIHAWQKELVIVMRQKVKPLKTKQLHQWLH
jgi:hypothetical protein